MMPCAGEVGFVTAALNAGKYISIRVALLTMALTAGRTACTTITAERLSAARLQARMFEDASRRGAGGFCILHAVCRAA
jgi:hypothetical protein